MAGGAIYAALLILQVWIATALLLGIAVWKIHKRKVDREGTRGILLWLSFTFVALALAFDWIAVAAGHVGNQTLVDLWRNTMLIASLAALILGSFGQGTGKVLLILTASAFVLTSRMLALAFLLQP
jgi:chromate transport protein ChrA